MIYTVTFNPSLDYIVYVEPFVEGAVNRTTNENIFVGGKGINVSLVLKNLGVENQIIGFAAGFTGKWLQQELEKLRCQADFILLSQGLTRINVKIKAVEETEINGRGPIVSTESLKHFFQKLEGLKKGDFLVLAGSIPDTLPTDIYERIIKEIEPRGVYCVVDATANLLLNVLKYRPFLIKPNHKELAELFQVDIQSEKELVFYGEKLKEMGARNVLISRAKAGAILLTESNETYYMEAPVGKVINSTGAGDAMVAGFLAGYMKNQSLKEAFQMGVAAGSATAFSENLATRGEIERIYKMIREGKIY